jgi:hypothetical protein
MLAGWKTLDQNDNLTVDLLEDERPGRPLKRLLDVRSCEAEAGHLLA